MCNSLIVTTTLRPAIYFHLAQTVSKVIIRKKYFRTFSTIVWKLISKPLSLIAFMLASQQQLFSFSLMILFQQSEYPLQTKHR